MVGVACVVNSVVVVVGIGIVADTVTVAVSPFGRVVRRPVIVIGDAITIYVVVAGVDLTIAIGICLAGIQLAVTIAVSAAPHIQDVRLSLIDDPCIQLQVSVHIAKGDAQALRIPQRQAAVREQAVTGIDPHAVGLIAAAPVSVDRDCVRIAIAIDVPQRDVMRL